jgi:hypothetical protein
MPTSIIILISTGRHWLPLELAPLHMRNRINEHHGTLMESMDTTWSPPCTTTDVNKFISQKQKARALLTLLSFSRKKCPCHIHLQKIWPALQLWNCPIPFKTHPLQRHLFTLEQRNFKHCANYQRFSQRPFHLELHNMHPQWCKTPHNSGTLSHRALAHR